MIDYMKASFNEWLKCLHLYNVLQSLVLNKKSLAPTFKHQAENVFHVSENPLFINLTADTKGKSFYFLQILCH